MRYSITTNFSRKYSDIVFVFLYAFLVQDTTCCVSTVRLHRSAALPLTFQLRFTSRPTAVPYFKLSNDNAFAINLLASLESNQLLNHFAIFSFQIPYLAFEVECKGRCFIFKNQKFFLKSFFLPLLLAFNLLALCYSLKTVSPSFKVECKGKGFILKNQTLFYFLF